MQNWINSFGLDCGLGCCKFCSYWTSKIGPLHHTCDREAAMECDQCLARFSLLKRKRTCSNCGLIFCKSCLKRSSGSGGRCHKCQVLSQWPIDMSQVTALRVRDLRHYLASKKISTSGCKEKSDLTELVIQHLRSQYAQSYQRPYSNVSSSCEYASPGSASPHLVATTSVHDDSIRVCPYSSLGSDLQEAQSPDSFSEGNRPASQVESPASPSSSSEGIRVFPSCDKASPRSPLVVPNKASHESDLGLGDLCEHVAHSSEDTDVEDTLTSRGIEPEEAGGCTAESSQNHSSSLPDAKDVQPPSRMAQGLLLLKSLSSEADVDKLTVHQCKELLTLHRVSYAGLREKSELLAKVKMLWKDHMQNRQDISNVPDDMICKICMDSIIDCVLLECGHMVTCIVCGKQMAECPVCRQYVVRVVRTFRA